MAYAVAPSSGSDSPSSSSSSLKVSLKLLKDPKEERVVFAEASKDFIDFLFNLLRLPLSTVTSVLTNNGMVGSLGKLHESRTNLSDDYLNNPKQDKDILLKPPVVPSATHPNLYMCKRRCKYAVTDTMNRECPRCGGRMSCAVPFMDSSKEGFVKGLVSYTVMDDLEVRPMSSILTVSLISKLDVKDISSLQERVVELGMKEGIKLLEASLRCKNVLTRVFLNNMAA